MSGKITTVLEKYDQRNDFSQRVHNDQLYQSFARPSEVDRLNLSEYLEILNRRKWIVLLTFILVVGAVTTVSLIMPTKYEATVRILLGMQPTLMNPVGDSTEHTPLRDQYSQTQISLLSSRTLAYKVLSNFRPEQIKALLPNYLPESLKSVLKKMIGSETKVADPPKKSTAKLPSPKVMKWYLDNLDVAPVKESSLVDISFTGTDAGFVTEIINKHAQTAIDYTVKQHQTQAKEALIWLKKQIKDQKTAVQDAQLAIYKFKKKNNILSLEDDQSEFSKEIQELNNTFVKAKSERIEKQAVYFQIKEIEENRKNILLLPEIADNAIFQSMRQQLTELNFKKIEMKTKYGPKHPKMIELNNGIRQLNAEMLLEIRRLKESIESDLDRARAIESSIKKTLNEQKQIAMSQSEKSIEYEVLKQQAQSAQDVYDFLLKQSEQLGLSSVISSSSMKVIDFAEIPIDPKSPKILLNILIAVFLSIFSGAGLAIVIDHLDNSIKTTEDIALRSGLPVLGMIPFCKDMLEERNAQVLLDAPKTDRKKLYYDSTTYHIANRLPEKLGGFTEKFNGRVLIIESVTSGEGKSTLAARISSNLAEAGQRVLLVDFDFLRPSQDKIFNISHKDRGLGRFIDLIQSQNPAIGTLQEYSADDLFFLIGLKRLSGHMTIKNDDQVFNAHFQHGVLLHIQNQNNPENNRLGAMLLNAGYITKEQLMDALNRNLRTQQPLGYILVNAGYISRDKLKGPLRLQIEEYLQKIFSWKNGVFQFQPENSHVGNDEMILFEEDYTPLMKRLGRLGLSRFFEKQLFSQIISIDQSNLYLLTAGRSGQALGALNYSLVEKVFEKLKLNFDVILVDTPPLEAASGIETIFQFADGIIVVVKSGKLKVKTFNEVVYHLPQDKIIGAVLNQVKIKPHVYY